MVELPEYHSVSRGILPLSKCRPSQTSDVPFFDRPGDPDLYNVYREVFLGNTDFASYGQFLGNYNTFGLFVLIWIVTLIHRPLSNRRLSALRWGVILGLLSILFWKTGSRSCHPRHDRAHSGAALAILLSQRFDFRSYMCGHLGFIDVFDRSQGPLPFLGAFHDTGTF